MPIFDLAHFKIIKVTFHFPKFASMLKIQLNSSINSKDIAVLKPHELNSHIQFDRTHSNIITGTFSFSEFVSACKKSTQFINTSLRYILEIQSHELKAHIHF